jgi:glyoxylase-like metal-dependent hydrolase (beta-lactamase superfamily II)
MGTMRRAYRQPKLPICLAAALAVGLVCGPLAAGQAGASGPASPRGPVYEVYAIRYAVSPGFAVAELVAGADPARKIDLPFVIWVLKGSDGRNILVDAGSYKGPVFTSWRLHEAVKPSEAIGKIGLKPEDVTDVIITHIHWDHVGGVDLFPAARVWIQRDEFTHYVDSAGRPKDEAIAPDDAGELAALDKAGRLILVEGDAREIIPGVTVYTGGKHTYACQYAVVRTAEGNVVLASDNIYLYENLEKRLASAQTSDPAADFKVQERILRLASSRRLIVPGHDPEIFKRFPAPGDGVARIR